MDTLIITFYNGVSKFTQYTAGISVPEIMLRVNLIINNYCNTHLFTNVLSSGHLQIRLNSL